MMCKQVVIIGAGFGGLWAARAFARENVDVTLIDRNNYHAFLPLLYQVAAAEIEPEQIAHPVRQILRSQHNISFMMANVTGINFDTRLVSTSAGEVAYDYVILALGSTDHDFGIAGVKEHAFPLKTIEHSIVLRHHILRQFERASNETDPARRRELLTFTIVGGGPTGVEYAGALQELINRPLKKDFHNINFDEVSVVLIEGRDRLLSMFDEKLSRYTLNALQKRGVNVKLNALVSEAFDDAVLLKDGAAIATDTIVWTAGVKGESLADNWKLPTAGAGQVAIEPTLHVPDMPNVYVIGDMAYLEQDGKPLPMLAQNAMQQGEHAAKNIVRHIGDEPLEPFRYKDLGAMATIGRNAAVAEIGNIKLTGFIAWTAWLGIHLINLIGFRNRLVVLINWAWDYFFFERVARLILTQPIIEKDSTKLEDRERNAVDAV